MKKFDKIVKFDKINNSCIHNDNKTYYEKKLTKLRENINELFFNHHLSKSMIAKKKKVSRNFVIKWTKSLYQDFDEDNRGWQKGKRRKWTKETEEKIKKIYHNLEKDPSQFYLGATAIEQEWRKKYSEAPPPLRTIGQILSDANLSKKIRRDRHQGAAKYLCYPEHTIFNLIAERVLELDFIGKKFIAGRAEPLNFISFSFKKEPKLRYFKRITGETGDEIIGYSKLFFEKFEKPDAAKMDNGFAMAGSPSYPRVISKVPLWHLSQEIIPIYAVPRKPFSQASIEGNNSVFARNFWKKIEFKSLKEVDKKLEWFNKSSERYLDYRKPKKNKSDKKFIPKIYFTRQVMEDQETKKGFIEVAREKILLPKSYINYFVLAEWKLKPETLHIYFEKEQKSKLVVKLIKKLSFKINPKSKEKLKKLKII
ncbi:hypothetical protein KKB43_05315 [Patescibacteria group bacterium]|nr:hypothetical protein [Patescibacteria group bacterium]MCG2701462.1 hypothetical protein [Candidatus Parcubacteria bacterium]MCG2809249.1 hypothetical protein [Candidatus Portnoybacteria bacterium]